jgi:DNA-binding CsgD family transcriptional regulator
MDGRGRIPHPPDLGTARALAAQAIALGKLAGALGLAEAHAPAFLAAFEAALALLPRPVGAEGRLLLPERLTPRECEVLGLLIGGLTDREIAVCLRISPHTATTHVKRVRGKLGGGNRAATIARALGTSF